MILKNKKYFILSIFLILGIVLTLASVSAADVQDISDNNQLASSDLDVVLTDYSEGAIPDVLGDGTDEGTNPDDPGSGGGTNPDDPSGGFGDGTDTDPEENTQKETNLTVTAADVPVGSDDATFNFTLTDSEGANIDGDVTLNIEGVVEKQITISEGIGSISLDLSGLSVGSYPYLASFAGNENYLSSTASGTLEIVKHPTNLAVTANNITIGEDTSIEITLTDANGNPIDDSVILSFNGANITVVREEGVLSYQLINPAAGTYPITVTYAGNETQASATATATLKVEKIKTVLKVSSPKIIHGSKATITVTLTDENGNNLNGVVVVKVNGKSYNVTVSSGKGSVSIANLGVKTYPVTATYATTPIYAASSAKSNLIVDPTKVSSQAQLTKAISNASTKTIQLTKSFSISSTINIKSRGALTIDGNGYTITGNNHRIFYIHATGVTLKNLIMKGGKADMGGAIWDDNKLTINKCTFTSNVATGKGTVGGGAIYKKGGSLSIVNSKFTSNVANKGNGGAIASFTNNVVINKTTFTSNKVKNGNGGAIASYNKGLKINGCTFKSNSATATKTSYGGALLLEGTTPSIKSTTFTSNTVKNHGGAILISKKVSGTIIDKCTFTSNKATKEDGGAISWSGAKGSITNCKFVSNTAKQDGGAIDSYNKVKRSPPVLTIKNCLFNKNKASKSAAAVFLGIKIKFTITGCNFTNNVKPKYGGALFFEGTSASVTSCKFSGNQASNSGGAIMVNTGGKMSINKCTFTSNKANIGGAIVNKAKGVTVQNTKFDKNTASRSGGAIALQKGSNTIKTSTFTAGKAIYGAGVFTIGGSATITKNTFKNNVASKLGGAVFKKGGKLKASANKFSGNKGGKSPNIYKK